MPHPDRPPLTRGVVVRGGGFALAIALGAIAVWLIVTSTTQKKLELGVLSGLWGLLLGAFCMFGARRHATETSGQLAPTVGAELELRSHATEVEHAAEVAARRAHEARIEQLLRQEIHNAVSREVGTLRAEVAQLRTELLEKVGGQLRLERIETTRVIGSDLEALQDEVRALKAVARDSDLGGGILRELGRPRVRPADPARQTASSQHGSTRVVEASVVETATIDGRTTSTVSSLTDARPTPTELTGPITPQRDPAAAAVAPLAPARPQQPASPAQQPGGSVQQPGGSVQQPSRPQGQRPDSEQRDRPPAQTPPPRTATPPPTRTPLAPVPAAVQPAAPAVPPAVAPTAAPLAPAAAPLAPAAAPLAPAASATPPAARPHTPAQRPPAQQTPAQRPPAQRPPLTPQRQAERPLERAASKDPFADLPRLSPFVDDSPEPPRPVTPASDGAARPATRTDGHAPVAGGRPATNGAAAASSSTAASAGAAPSGVVPGQQTRPASPTGAQPGPAVPAGAAAGGHDRGPSYQGRRRRTDERFETQPPPTAPPTRLVPPTAPVPAAAPPRTAASERSGTPAATGSSAAAGNPATRNTPSTPATRTAPAAPGTQAAQPSEAGRAAGGRRRRSDDQPDDLLAKLLAREHH